MDLSAYQRMDANILLGIVNEKLRLECADLGGVAAALRYVAGCSESEDVYYWLSLR